MNIKSILTVCFVVNSICSAGQTESVINLTDQQGRKQGHWIKNYPNKNILFDGYFKDDHPVGEFKRYYSDRTLKSLLIYSEDGRRANAAIYHPNGNLSSKGTYVDQKKEGRWQFFSRFIKGYLVAEDYYQKNLKNGPSVKFFPDSTVAEKLTYVNDVKQGQWIQFYPSGKVLLKSNFVDGKINGKFEVWFENGSINYSGQYKNDSRDGQWIIFNADGSVKYRLIYVNGITTDRHIDIDESNFLDSLENNRGKIADPEKTGVISE